jgi:hypothetical protein
MRLTGQFDKIKGLMHQKKDQPKCIETNEGLSRRLEEAVMMMESFDESLRSGLRLNERFDRTFE